MISTNSSSDIRRQSSVPSPATGDREGLEDMAQEVFLRLFRALPHFRGEAQISTFIYRIIVNVVNDEFRDRKKARLASPIKDEDARELAYSSAGPAVLAERANATG